LAELLLIANGGVCSIKWGSLHREKITHIENGSNEWDYKEDFNREMGSQTFQHAIVHKSSATGLKLGNLDTQ